MTMADWKEKKTESVEDILRISETQGDIPVKVKGQITTNKYKEYYTGSVGGFGLLSEKLFFSWNANNLLEYEQVTLFTTKAEEKKQEIEMGGVYSPRYKRIKLKYFKNQVSDAEYEFS